MKRITLVNQTFTNRRASAQRFPYSWYHHLQCSIGDLFSKGKTISYERNIECSSIFKPHFTQTFIENENRKLWAKKVSFPNLPSGRDLSRFLACENIWPFSKYAKMFCFILVGPIVFFWYKNLLWKIFENFKLKKRENAATHLLCSAHFSADE